MLGSNLEFNEKGAVQRLVLLRTAKTDEVGKNRGGDLGAVLIGRLHQTPPQPHCIRKHPLLNIITSLSCCQKSIELGTLQDDDDNDNDDVMMTMVMVM